MLTRINHVSFPFLGLDDITLNTNAVEFSNGMKVAWYGVIIMIGIICATVYAYRRLKEDGKTLDDLIDFAILTIFLGVVGSRVYFVIFEFDSFLVTSGNFFYNFGKTFLNIVAVWNGGLAIYGAIIGGAVGATVIARKKKMPILRIFDFFAPGVMLAQAIGRWGNFVNAEAHGGETDIFCKMGIQNIFGQWVYVHPTFLYESLWNVIGFCIIHFVFVKHFKKFDGEIFYLYIAWYGIGRFFVEGLRTDSLYLGSIRISQLVGIVCFVVGVAMLVYNFIKLKKGEKQNGTNH